MYVATATPRGSLVSTPALQRYGIVPAGSRPIRSLSDTPFEWFAKWLSGDEFDATVIEVRKRVQSNYYPWTCLQIVNCLTYDTVENILTCYMQMALEGLIPEYVAGLGPEELTPDSALAVSGVMQCSGQGRQLVEWCLYELYWGTKDGSVPSNRTLNPLSSKAWDDYRADDPDDWDLGDYLKWGVIGGAVFVTGYFLAQLTGFIDKVDGDDD